MTKERHFDAIFLDVQLPDISGPEIYARLAQENMRQAQATIFVTGGLWRKESRGLIEELPARPMLAKPCTREDIRSALRALQPTLGSEKAI